MPPFFSVIIPTLNEEKNLPVLLENLSLQIQKNFEVIVSDSFSTDQTKNICLSYQNILPLTFLQNHTKNVSEARNLGAQKASGEFLIFFDADVQIAKDFCEQIAVKIAKYQLDLLTVWNYPQVGSGWKGKFILSLLNAGLTLLQNISPAANGPCIIIKKTLFQKIKGFREDIVFAEDLQLIKATAAFKPKFRVFTKPKLYLSTRRFDQEGIILTLYKSIYALIYQTFVGPITKPLFEYKMGGKNFEEQ